MPVLVSFYNNLPYHMALGLFDFDSSSMRWIDLEGIGERFVAVNGLCRSGNRYYALIHLSELRGGLAVFDSQLKLLRRYEFREVKDPHSIVPFDDGFLVNDTLRNRLIYVTGIDGELHEAEYWRSCDDQTDAVHLNSVAVFKGDVYVSLFGVKHEFGWRHTKLGKIVNVSANEVVSENITQPHSLTVIDGELHWVESGTGLLYRLASDGKCEVIAKLDGYARGIAHDESHLYVAASGYRRRSKTTGTWNREIPADMVVHHSWMNRLDRKTFEVQRQQLTAFGMEIYDLLGVEPEDVADLAIDADPGIRRFWRWEDDYRRLEQKLNDTEHAREDSEHARMDSDHLREEANHARDESDRLRQLADQARQESDRRRQEAEQLAREMELRLVKLEAVVRNVVNSAPYRAWSKIRSVTPRSVRRLLGTRD